MRRADIITAGLLLALCLGAIAVIIPRYVSGSTGAGVLSPAFMPYVAAALATFAAALLLLMRVAERRPRDEAAPLPPHSWLFIGTAGAVLALAFVLMDAFGYLPGAVVIVAGFMAIARAGIKAIVGAAVVFPAVLFVLFDTLLGFPLP